MDNAANHCAVLNANYPEALETIFQDAIKDVKTLHEFFLLVRSGKFGRRGFGAVTKRAIRDWLASRSDEELFAAGRKHKTGLKDILALTRPQPATTQRSSLYAWIMGAKFKDGRLVEKVHYKLDGKIVDSTRGYGTEVLPTCLRDWLETGKRQKRFHWKKANDC